MDPMWNSSLATWESAPFSASGLLGPFATHPRLAVKDRRRGRDPVKTKASLEKIEDAWDPQRRLLLATV